MMRTICGAQLKHRECAVDLMLMLGLSEIVDQLAMANHLHWYGHVLVMEDLYSLRNALEFEVGVNGQMGG